MTVTIKDVARETGLSIATISKYLNGGNVLDENRAVIDAAVERLGYKANTLARGLKTNRSMTVGVLIPDLRNIFCTTIVSSLENALMQAGYGAIVCDCAGKPELEAEKLRFLLHKQVDGLILLPSGGALPALAELAERGVPVVLVDRALEGQRCDTVLVDNLNASYAAVERLIALGHRRVGIICGPEGVFTARERLLGYRRVHEDYNLPVDESLVKQGGYDVESGHRLFNKLMDAAEPPTALFVTNYEMTLGVVMAANERNVRFPADVSFIGFDNLDLARVVKPRLTIVSQPTAEIGETAAATLLKRLKGDAGNFPALVRLKTSLIEGESVRER